MDLNITVKLQTLGGCKTEGKNPQNPGQSKVP